MTRYLVVAYQTADSPELQDCLLELAAREPDVEFALLVPATPIRHLLSWQEGEAETVAYRKAEAAKVRLRAAGLPIVRSSVGPASPLSAIERQLQADGPVYDGLIIATFPQRLSRWLERDLPRRAEQRFGLPTLHVVAQPQKQDPEVRPAPAAEPAEPPEEMRRHRWTLQEAGAWRGRDAVAWDGGRLGRISEVLYDYDSVRPVWLVIQSGLLGIRSRLVPVRAVEPLDDHVRVLYSTSRVLNQPHVDIGQGFDSLTDERLLCEYFDEPQLPGSELRVLGPGAHLPYGERVITPNR